MCSYFSGLILSRHVESSTIWPIHHIKPDPKKPGLKSPERSIPIRRIPYIQMHLDDSHNTDLISYLDVSNDNH